MVTVGDSLLMRFNCLGLGTVKSVNFRIKYMASARVIITNLNRFLMILMWHLWWCASHMVTMCYKLYFRFELSLWFQFFFTPFERGKNRSSMMEDFWKLVYSWTCFNKLSQADRMLSLWFHSRWNFVCKTWPKMALSTN